MASQIQKSLNGYRTQMILMIIFALSIIVLASLTIVKKLIKKSRWLTGIAALLIVSQISILLSAIVYYSQYNLLWEEFPQPPTQSDVTEAKRLLNAFDWLTELYYASITSVYIALAGLIWISSTRIFQLHTEGMTISNGPKAKLF